MDASALSLPDEAHGVRIASCLERAQGNLARRQEPRGSWAGDYGGPMFLLPMYIALCHAAGEPIEAPRQTGMIRYLASALRDDGSFGLHAEASQGSMFTTSLGYVALRMLGLAEDDPRIRRMRRWIHDNGTPLGAAAWGKFTLCLLGLYDWRGVHPILPELWLLPARAPMHPARLWCHCRQVYLPMSWLYAQRAQVPSDPLILQLRAELYPQGFARIAWGREKDTLSRVEAYRPKTLALQLANRAMNWFEARVPPALRKRALAEVFEHIGYEDEVTSYIDIGPVNKVLNAFVHHFRDPRGAAFRRSFAACELYLWDGHDGTKMQSYNSSELWDTAFALQAMLAARRAVSPSPLYAVAPPGGVVERAYGYLRDNQILDDVPERGRYYRHASRGGWPFSNRAHGWPITDCTAEALKCVLDLQGEVTEEVPGDLVWSAVRLILSWQNDDGGFATYERTRGGRWLELLNPSEVFGDIMVDYSYVECTSACVQALARARRRFPAMHEEIAVSLRRAERFLRQQQRPDGSFEGAWGVCFTYGTWFGVSGLQALGARLGDPAVERACAFLLDQQRPNGGWGEHGDSCRLRRYIQAPDTQVVQTAWALLALVRADHPSHAAQARAVSYLVSQQTREGSWPREALVGVFNRTCLINYDNYRHYFPMWAIAEWSRARRQGSSPDVGSGPPSA